MVRNVVLSIGKHTADRNDGDDKKRRAQQRGRRCGRGEHEQVVSPRDTAQKPVDNTDRGDSGIIVGHYNDAGRTQYEHRRAHERAALRERGVTGRLWPATRVCADKRPVWGEVHCFRFE